MRLYMHNLARKSNMSRTIAGTVLAACLCCPVRAQPAAAKLEFEVASIKPATLPGGPGRGDPGRVTYTFSTMLDLLVDAYSVKRNQISGGPNWLDSDRFDIVAKIPAGATKEQVNVMLQNLLAERTQCLHQQLRIFSTITRERVEEGRPSGATVSA